MRNPFKKTAPVPVIEFKQARDMWSFAFHVEDKEGLALCGAKSVMSGTEEVTAQKIISSLHLQHGGWYWCPSCASTLTGESKETIMAQRRK